MGLGQVSENTLVLLSRFFQLNQIQKNTLLLFILRLQKKRMQFLKKNWANCAGLILELCRWRNYAVASFISISKLF